MDGRSKARIGNVLHKELAVPTAMNKLPQREATQGEATEYERFGLVGPRLAVISALFGSHMSGPRFLDTCFVLPTGGTIGMTDAKLRLGRSWDAARESGSRANTQLRAGRESRDVQK